MRALVLDAEGRTAGVKDIRRPIPASHEILVHVEAISLNPIDSLYVANPLASSGRTVGSDFSGTVAAVGSQVPPTAIVHGCRVAGFLQGACSVNDRPGAFAEYVVIPWDLVWKVPKSLTIEEAASVSLVALTAAQTVWYRLGLDAPFSYIPEAAKPEHLQDRPTTQSHITNILIYGASTSVGLYAAQLVRLSTWPSGHVVRLFGAASRARWSMLKAGPYNYHQLVDYHDADWHEQIRALSAEEGMHYILDAISEGETVQHASLTLALNGRMAIVRSREGGAWSASNMLIEPIYGAVWEGLGEEVQYQGLTVQRSPVARDFAVRFYRWLSSAIGSDLRPVTIRLMPGALDRVVADGFELLGAGGMKDRRLTRDEVWMRPVSAEKLVYRIQDSLSDSSTT